MPSSRKYLLCVRKTLELERIAGRVQKEHCRLFANLALKANARCNHEGAVRFLQPVGERLPVGPLEYHSKMSDRHVVAIDGVRSCRVFLALEQMQRDLMAEEIDIYPAITAATGGAIECVTVKVFCRVEIVDRECQVKRS